MFEGSYGFCWDRRIRVKAKLIGFGCDGASVLTLQMGITCHGLVPCPSFLKGRTLWNLLRHAAETILFVQKVSKNAVYLRTMQEN